VDGLPTQRALDRITPVQLASFPMPSSQSPSQASGFEAYILGLAHKASKAPVSQLAPDFETWEDSFAYVHATGPLPITLPGGGKTNLELMRFMDAVRKQQLELVDVEGKPGKFVLCTPAQAAELKAQLPPAPARSRYYLSTRS
jgi:hypothetical protein